MSNTVVRFAASYYNRPIEQQIEIKPDEVNTATLTADALARNMTLIGIEIKPDEVNTVTLTADALARNMTLIGFDKFPITSAGTILPGTEKPTFFITSNFDPDQSWYWTKEWQAEEREAREDFASGRSQVFSNLDDFISSLDDLLPEK